MYRFFVFTLLALLPFFSGCGGSGGGGATEGNPAFVTIDATPRKIDSGDRITVTLHLFDIQVKQFPGLIVKVLHPSAFRYVSESATFSTRDDLFSEFEPRNADADESAYLLFYVDSNDVPEDDRSGVIEFVLRGLGEIRDGVIAVDLDVVNQDNRHVFDPTNPLFTSLTSLMVDVTG